MTHTVPFEVVSADERNVLKTLARLNSSDFDAALRISTNAAALRSIFEKWKVLLSSIEQKNYLDQGECPSRDRCLRDFVQYVTDIRCAVGEVSRFVLLLLAESFGQGQPSVLGIREEWGNVAREMTHSELFTYVGLMQYVNSQEFRESKGALRDGEMVEIVNFVANLNIVEDNVDFLYLRYFTFAEYFDALSPQFCPQEKDRKFAEFAAKVKSVASVLQ